MRIVCFELTFPNRGSWNGHWSDEREGHCLFKKMKEKEAQKYNGRDWYYNFGDGWCANISATINDAYTTRFLKRKNGGFCGYNWMVDSIMAYDEIRCK